jgi:hypothetical protein
MSMLLADKASLDEALEHYGVLGMKWGVSRTDRQLAKAAGRKAKESDRGLASKEERKAARVNSKQEIYGKAGQRRIERMFGETGLGTVPYSELATKQRTIKAGETFYRTSGLAEETARGPDDIKYVSRTEEDRNRYHAILPKYTFKSGLKDIAPTYDHTYKTVTKLTLPSEKDRIDAFAELMDMSSVKLGNKTFTGREVLKRAGYRRDVRRLDNTALGQKFFEDMQTTAWMNTGLSNEYFENLRSKGFNAVADDNDRGVVTDDPIILLNPSGTIKSMNVKQLTAKDVNTAMTTFKGDLKEERG